MDQVWVLVEWVVDDNVFSAYEVVKLDTFSYQESELQPGKHIFICVRNGDPRRAKIIKISDNKRQVKEHKEFLERQDQQVKNVLQLCMRTIREMKTGQFSSSALSSHAINATGSHSGMPHVITAATDSSETDSDVEVPQKIQMNRMTKYKNQTHQNVRYDHGGFKRETQSPVMNLPRRYVASSTPLPGKCVPEVVKLCYDQGTQTEIDWSSSVSKIEEIEMVLHHLYARFQSMFMTGDSAGESHESESEQNGEVSFAETNESWIHPHHVYDYAEDISVSGYVDGTQNATVNQSAEAPSNSVQPETVNKRNEKPRVRRMSAQTTYTNEMVPIGKGGASVPARLLNEINWSSYTSATRQLLQALFPRKVLATHSLTGKPSPAHLNKPAKKLLDPTLVDDIVTIVSSQCGVPKNLVRNSITVKCTDEAKLYRNRQQFLLSRTQQKNQQNNENEPPNTANSLEAATHLKPI